MEAWTVLTTHARTVDLRERVGLLGARWRACMWVGVRGVACSLASYGDHAHSGVRVGGLACPGAQGQHGGTPVGPQQGREEVHVVGGRRGGHGHGHGGVVQQRVQVGEAREVAQEGAAVVVVVVAAPGQLPRGRALDIGGRRGEGVQQGVGEAREGVVLGLRGLGAEQIAHHGHVGAQERRLLHVGRGDLQKRGQSQAGAEGGREGAGIRAEGPVRGSVKGVLRRWGPAGAF